MSPGRTHFRRALPTAEISSSFARTCIRYVLYPDLFTSYFSLINQRRGKRVEKEAGTKILPDSRFGYSTFFLFDFRDFIQIYTTERVLFILMI